MDKLSNSIKCGICTNTLVSPVILPCGDSVCKKHTIDCKGSILCETCGMDHQISDNYEFPSNKTLNVVIDAHIAVFCFGKDHKEAKESCERFDEFLTNVEQTLNDPYNAAYELITYLKNQVQLKGEEIILNTQENMNQTISKLDEYINEFKNGLNKKCEVTSKNLRNEKETGRRELAKWLATLNEVKINKMEVRLDEQTWKQVKIESEKAIESFENKLVEFKIDLFPESFLDLRNKIENEFEIESPSGLL
jgi:hypothetical protein